MFDWLTEPLNTFFNNAASYSPAVLALILAVVIIGALLLGGKYIMVPSDKKFEARQNDNSVAIATLKEQIMTLNRQKTEAQELLETRIAELSAQVKLLQEEVRRMQDDEDFNREYRHAVVNQANAFLSNYGVARDLTIDMRSEWKDCPAHFKTRIERLPTTTHLLESIPIPKKGE